MRFHVPPEHDSLTINGRDYTPDEDGIITATTSEDHGLLRQLGCRSENDPAPVRVEPSEPPPLPEGYVDPEVVRGLIEENEDQKIAIEKLHGDNNDLRHDIEKALEANSDLAGKLASANQVEDELRRRIQELEGQLAHARATETTPEEQLQALADENAIVEEKATETAPPAKKAK